MQNLLVMEQGELGSDGVMDKLVLRSLGLGSDWCRVRAAHPGVLGSPEQGRHPDHHLAVRQHGSVRDLRSHRRPDCCPVQVHVVGGQPHLPHHR
eukprot:1800869-Rhodomonas_salina.1